MDIRYSISPNESKSMTTNELRKNFLVNDLFIENEIKMTYSFDDRMIVGGCMPIEEPLVIDSGDLTGTEYFMSLREMGIYNLGDGGIISVDGKEYELSSDDVIYIGKGTKSITFSRNKKENRPKFYFVSVPAHKNYPTKKVALNEAIRINLGCSEESNKRTIFQYIHPDLLESCQLLMGITLLDPCNVWNTMPTHTHLRRMETYLYCKMPKDELLIHLMGEEDETRHIIVRNEQAVISPSWSIHSGVGTSNYAFIWGMGGENKEFTDMQLVQKCDLK